MAGKGNIMKPLSFDHYQRENVLSMAMRSRPVLCYSQKESKRPLLHMPFFLLFLSSFKKLDLPLTYFFNQCGKQYYETIIGIKQTNKHSKKIRNLCLKNTYTQKKVDPKNAFYNMFVHIQMHLFKKIYFFAYFLFGLVSNYRVVSR